MKNVPLLEARRISLGYTPESPVFEDIDISLGRGEFLAIVGPSGCGKTSLLKVLGGFLQPDSGRVFRAGVPARQPSPDAVMIFQEFDQLFPWKRVWANISLPLHTRSRKRGPVLPRPEIRQRVEELLREVGLYDFRGYFPHQLSGGMKQRAALARALVTRPPVLLMDEPFGSLDARKRGELQGLLLRMWAEHGFSVVFVTHDIPEALLLADRIFVMERPGPREEARPMDVPGAASGDALLPGQKRKHQLLEVGLPRPRDPRNGDFIQLHRSIFAMLGPETE